MYHALIVIQIIAILICFACVILLTLQKDTQLAKLMLMIVICGFVQNAGYLMELTSTNLTEVMMAVRFEYIGAAFIVNLMTVFVFKYCKVRFPKWIQYILFSVSILVLISVWTYQWNPLYYTSAEFVNTGLMPHVVLGKGPLYIVYAVMIYMELICSGAVSLIAVLRTKERKMHKNCFLLFLSCVIPFLAHLLGVIGIIEGYDTAPLGVALGIAVSGIAIACQHIFDVVETAHESILMNLNDAIIIVDQALGFEEANAKALELFPVLQETSYGEKIPDKGFNKIFNKNGAKEIVIGERFYNVHINTVYNNKKIAGYTVILFDVTENKFQLEKMRELKEQADQANQAKSAFLANVSHEIRTPINAVLGLNEVILRDYEEPQLVEYSKNIQNSARTLLQLINDILDFSKIEAGKMELALAKYCVSALFSDLLSIYSFRAEKKGLKLSSRIAGSIPKYLTGDMGRIKQILSNIMTNAVKYTSDGEIIFRAAFEQINEEKGNLILSVEDTGIGIHESDIDRLFDGFVRLDEKNNRTIEGTGLGLNITKQLLDLMDGELKVYSEYGKGSVFTAIIPQDMVPGQYETVGDLSADMDAKPAQRAAFTAPDAKILIVDDSKTNLMVAQALLKEIQAQLTLVLSGEECLECIQKEHYDVIFLDHRMPHMDGIETLHHMKSMSHMCEDTPVIMLTANAVNDARGYYIEEGFDDFISKPITEKTISDMVYKYLPRELIIEETDRANSN